MLLTEFVGRDEVQQPTVTREHCTTSDRADDSPAGESGKEHRDESRVTANASAAARLPSKWTFFGLAQTLHQRVGPALQALS
jgi:hypothetical protein